MEMQYNAGQRVNLNTFMPAQTLEGTIVKLGNGQVILDVDCELTQGVKVRLDLADSILLGEVRSCQTGADGCQVDVAVLDAIPLMPDIGHLVIGVIRSHAQPSIDVHDHSAVRAQLA